MVWYKKLGNFLSKIGIVLVYALIVLCCAWVAFLGLYVLFPLFSGESIQRGELFFRLFHGLVLICLAIIGGLILILIPVIKEERRNKIKSWFWGGSSKNKRLKKLAGWSIVIILFIGLFACMHIESRDYRDPPELIPESFKFDVGDKIVFTANTTLNHWKGKHAIIIDVDEKYCVKIVEHYKCYEAYYVKIIEDDSCGWFNRRLVDGHAKNCS